jgi:hypothetical protein
MAYLAAAVAALAALGLVNLTLTLGVVRRLRDMAPDPGSAGLPRPVLAPGEVPGRIAATALDGESVTGAPLVGFFAPNCAPCHDRLPQFVEYARQLPGGADDALAVIVGDPDEGADLIAAVHTVARVVVEPTRGPVASAYGVSGYPALCLVDGSGTVVASGTDLSSFPAPAYAVG